MPDDTPAASVVIPTRARPDYLGVALHSLLPQARDAAAEVIVVCDGPDSATAAVAAQDDVRLVTLTPPRGANAARNAGVAASRAELIVFVDDDVRTPPGWLRALLDGAAAWPDHDVFGGPIRAALEGGGPRACGREPAPITTLDLGAVDRDADLVWSANMAVRAASLRRTGEFDESIAGRGEEEEWQRRNASLGGRVRYVAAAGVEHRRTATDATLPALARSAYRLGRSARRYDLRKGTAPSLARELRVLTGCAWHTVRRRCAIGLVMAAHTAGRLREAVPR